MECGIYGTAPEIWVRSQPMQSMHIVSETCLWGTSLIDGPLKLDILIVGSC